LLPIVRCRLFLQGSQHSCGRIVLDLLEYAGVAAVKKEKKKMETSRVSSRRRTFTVWVLCLPANPLARKALLFFVIEAPREKGGEREEKRGGGSAIASRHT